MAVIQVNYMSQALWRIVPLQVILPADKADTEGNLLPIRKYKTLYLLGGMHGSQNDWVVNTRIRIWAEERNLAVVMPAGENAFYVDQEDSHRRYGEFVGREIVEITRRMFPLSDKREDTFIGGLSMGGFGALRNGLNFPKTFGAVICLSGAVDILSAPKVGEDLVLGEAMFGPLEEAVRSDKNPRVLIEKLKKAKVRPSIYLCCGTEDRLLPQSRAFRTLLEDAGFDLTYVEGPGNHNWDFWDTYIKKALDWLPLDDLSQGKNSGNID